MIRLRFLASAALAFVFWTHLSGPLIGQAGLRDSLEKLDRNQNGYIEPDEVTPLSRPYLERILKGRSRRSNFRPGPASRSHSRQPTRSLSTPGSLKGFRTRTRRRIRRGTAPPRRRRRPPIRAVPARYAAANLKSPNRGLGSGWPLIACCSGAAFAPVIRLPPAWRILCKDRANSDWRHDPEEASE